MSGQLAGQLVKVEVNDRVATVILNNPSKRNSLSPTLLAQFAQALDSLEDDAGVGAIVLTGAAPAFCAGADRRRMEQASGSRLPLEEEGLLRIARCPLPTVAAVNGPAIGAGMNLALNCDMRLVAREARFESKFPQLGIHPGGGHIWLLTTIAGPAAAAAMVLFGDVVRGPRAVEIGLAHECHEEECLLTCAQEHARRAAELPPHLARALKKTLRQAHSVLDFEQAVEIERDLMQWSRDRT